MDIEKQLYSSGQVMADEELEVLSLGKCGEKKRPPRVFRWRDSWLGFLPAFIVFYSFVKEIKVSEPYLFLYQTEYLNLTREQIKAEIYPYNPYSYLISLIPIFLLTDFLLYKPTMLLEIVGQIGCRVSLVFFSSIVSQILGMISYGVASASEIGFFSYVYARLEKDEYRRLTSWTRAGTMSGRTFGYALSQLIILAHLGNYYTLNVIAFILPCIVLVFCLCMPSVSWKRMAQRIEVSRVERALAKGTAVENVPMPQSYGQYLKQRISTLHSDFIQIYSSTVVRRWSFYWAMGTSLSLQFALLSQTLWGEVQSGGTTHSPLNGFAEASYTLIAALAILGTNSVNLDWEKWGELVLILISIVDAVITIVYARAESIYVMYGCYIGYRSLYQVMITISQWNIAKNLKSDNYALVFGCNSFVALLMQCILTAIVTDQRGLNLTIRDQYIVYGCCHMVVAIIFIFCVSYRACGSMCRRQAIMPAKKMSIYNVESNKSMDSGLSD